MGSGQSRIFVTYISPPGLGTHNFGAKINRVVIEIQDPHFPGRLVPGAVTPLIQDECSVVTLPHDCHVMPLLIIHSRPVKAHYPGSATEIESQLEVTVYNL